MQSKCFKKILKTLQVSRELNQSVCGNEKNQYLKNYSNLENQKCDLIQNIHEMVEQNKIDQSIVSKLVNSDNSKNNINDMNNSLKEVGKSIKDSNNVKILENLKEFEDIIITIAKNITKDELISDTIVHFGTLIDQANNNYVLFI